MTNIIIRPIITEKSVDKAQKGSFTFEVAKTANKKNIKKAVENTFKVNVVSVSTNITKGKKKRFGNKRTEISIKDIKKAVVKLKSGEKIDLFDISEK